MKIQHTILIAFLSTLLFGCEKFLDVQPQGTLTEDVMFRDVQGYRDAMYGVYGSMANPELYGEKMTYGFVDKIGQMFIYNNNAHIDKYITNFEYNHKEVKGMCDTIWAGQYTAISYLNNVIGHLKDTELKHSDLKLIEGEAHALRAFLHFDVARLYTEDYRRATNAQGIPYAYTFDLKNKKLFSLQDTYKNILADLTTAEKLLENDNAISHNRADITSDYEKGRYAHCNKFAVKAIKARVYYSMGNADSAAFFAKQVIDAKDNFQLEDFSNFNNVKRFPSPKELIFGLSSNRLTDNIYTMFLSGSGSGNYVQGRDNLYSLYEVSKFSAGNTDVRYSAYYKEVAYNTYAFIRYLENETEVKNNPVKGIGLIRLPEMFYILAESVYDKDQTQAIGLLNEVRKSRGLLPINNAKVSTKEDFEKEMIKERMREMPGEGQVFFALKHYNRPFTKAINNVQVEPSSEIFVLPWPQKELEFGNR